MVPGPVQVPPRSPSPVPVPEPEPKPGAGAGPKTKRPRSRPSLSGWSLINATNCVWTDRIDCWQLSGEAQWRGPVPTGPSAARFPLPVRLRATWGSPDRLMCEWPECRAGPHLSRDAKINCCRRRGLVRPAVASYLIVRVCVSVLRERLCVYVCRYRYGHGCTRRSAGPWYRWVPQPRERHGRSKGGAVQCHEHWTDWKAQGSSPHLHANNNKEDER